MQPCSFTPAASARAWVSRPGKAGSRLGWMFSIGPRQRAPGTASAAACSRRGRRSRSPAARNAASIAASCAARSPRNGAMVDHRRGTPAAAASARPGGVRAVGQHQRDLGREVGSRGRSEQRRQLEPRPLISTRDASRFMRASRPAASIRTSAAPVAGLDVADAEHGLARRFQQRGAAAGVGDHQRHADAAVEHAQHFVRPRYRRRGPARRTPAAPASAGSTARACPPAARAAGCRAGRRR